MVEAQTAKWLHTTPPVAILDAASALTTEIDTKGWNYAEISVGIGASDIAMTALAVPESASAGSGHANVTGLIFGTSTNVDGSTSAFPCGTDDNQLHVFQVDLRGRKRYLDVTATAGDGSAGTFVAIQTRLSRGVTAPTTAAEAGAAELLRV